MCVFASQMCVFVSQILCVWLPVWVTDCVFVNQICVFAIHRYYVNMCLATCAQVQVVCAEAVIHEPFQLYSWTGPSKPDLNWIMVEMAESISFNLSIPNIAWCIPSRCTHQAVSALLLRLKWRKGQRSQGVVTRVTARSKDQPSSCFNWSEEKARGNSSYSKVERSTYPLLELINFSCIIWQPDHRRFKWPTSTSKYCVFMLGLLWCASVSVSVWILDVTSLPLWEQ